LQSRVILASPVKFLGMSEFAPTFISRMVAALFAPVIHSTSEDSAHPCGLFLKRERD
jgi:hypothetical protein